MIINGRAIAEEMYANLSEARKGFGALSLGIVVVGTNPVVASFVRIKERSAERLNVTLVRKELAEDSSTGKVIEAVQELVQETSGIIVQLPLPGAIDAEQVLASIPASHDVDGINPLTSEEEKKVRPPVAGAIAEIFERNEVEAKGKKAVVVGLGRLVGAPAVELLEDMGATVSIVTQTRGSIEELKSADIVVLGAGNPGFVKPEMLKEGVVLIDAGTSEMENRIAGDADPACAEVASVYTPVPGGVGPIAVAMIFKNLFALVENR